MDEVPSYQCRDVLDTYPGIWYVSIPNAEVIIEASDNYHERWNGRWKKLPPVTMPNGHTVTWLIPKVIRH